MWCVLWFYCLTRVRSPIFFRFQGVLGHSFLGVLSLQKANVSIFSIPLGMKIVFISLFRIKAHFPISFTFFPIFTDSILLLKNA